MCIETRDTKTLYTKAWILLNLYHTTMAEHPKDHAPKAPLRWSEEMEEVDEYIERSGMSVPPVAQLLEQVNKLEGVKLPEEEVMAGDRKDNPIAGKGDELDKLMDSELDTGPWGEPFGPIGAAKGKEKAVVEQTSRHDEAEYQESFASQRETTQLREDLEVLGTKYEGLEEQLALIMRERDNLPEALNQIKAELNRELTAFSEKLYKLLENQAPQQDIQSAISQVDEIRAEHSEQLRTAVGYLKQPPKKESPLVTRGISLKGKGKFKPVK